MAEVCGWTLGSERMTDQRELKWREPSVAERNAAQAAAWWIIEEARSRGDLDQRTIDALVAYLGRVSRGTGHIPSWRLVLTPTHNDTTAPVSADLGLVGPHD